MSVNTAYDQALLEVGENGKYQKGFDILYNVVLAFLWAMAYMNIILALTIIPHTCSLNPKPENVSTLDWKLKNIPLKENNSGEYTFDSCLVYSNITEANETAACGAYDYDTTWYGSTVVSDYNWVCDKDLNVANVFAYTRIAEIVGSMFFGWFGDTYGRRPTYIVTLFLLIVGRVISLLANKSFIIFVIGCIIASLPSWSVVQTTTVISIEISSPKRRTTTATMRFVAFSFGVCLMPFVYWWLRDWKTFMIVTTLTQIPFFIMSWKMIESPRWLWTEGKNKACLNELKKIAIVNGKHIKENTEQELLTTAPEKNNDNLGPLALFSAKMLAMNTILQLLIWVFVSLSYTVLLFSSGEKTDGNPFLEFSWQSLAEIPGNFVGAWLADHIGRRYAGSTSFAVASLMWILVAIREHNSGTWLGSWWFGAVIVFLSRLATTVSYYTINLFNMELYPTCLRQSGMALGNVLSNGGSALAPYVLYMGHHVDKRLPGVILTLTSLLGALSSFMLPETHNQKLPETLEDAQLFGRDKKNESETALDSRIK